MALYRHQGLLVYALLEAGYLVYPINPKAMDRYRDRHRMSSSKSAPKDAMVLANILRTDLHLYKSLPRETAGDARLKQLTPVHKSLIQLKRKATFIYESLQQPSLRAPMELEEVHQTIVCNLVSVLCSLLNEIEKLFVDSHTLGHNEHEAIVAVDEVDCLPRLQDFVGL